MNNKIDLEKSSFELIKKRSYFKFLNALKNKEYLFIHTNETLQNYEDFLLESSRQDCTFYGTLYGAALIGKPPINLGYVWKFENGFQITSNNKDLKYCATRIDPNILILDDDVNYKRIEIRNQESLDELICEITLKEFIEKPLLTQQFPMILFGLKGFN